MLFRLASALGLALLCALAVDLGFGAAFVDNSVAFLVAAYVGALTGLLFGRDGLGAAGHPALRGFFGVVIAIGTLASLRTWAFFNLPFGEFVTSGHSPYFALPLLSLLVTLGLQLLVVVAARGKLTPEVASVLEG